MLTLPVESGTTAANPVARVLVIGRSENVLSELVTILRDKGYAAGATNEFDRVPTLFDAGRLDLVVFGGMVPPEVKEHLRARLSDRNAGLAFLQGYAGIPGLLAVQVEAALGGSTPRPGSVSYDARTRSVGVSLDGPQHVTVTAWWGTSFVPPEPKSTSRVILDRELAAGAHAIAIPSEVPAQASFATVSVGPSVHAAFIVGPMPKGTTLASFPDPLRPSGSPPAKTGDQMNTMTPPLTAVIGQTENTLRAILGRQLAGTGVTYPQWTALILVSASGGPSDRGQLTGRLATALQADQATAGSHIDALAASGLVQADADVALTEAGRQLFGRVQKQTGEITRRLWGDLPAADLETTSRVLATILERAKNELGSRS